MTTTTREVANTYRVTVKVAVEPGLAHQSAEVRVNIQVTDIDEDLSITAPDDVNLADTP